MNMRRSQVLLCLLGIMLIGLGIASFTQESTAAEHAAAEADELVFQADLNDLQPCGYYKEIRHFHTPDPVTPAPVSSPNPNAAPPTQPPPTSTPRPAPSEDRVGFPENYETDFKLLFVFNRSDRKLLRAICGNAIAAQRQPGEPFAYGSVLLMISHAAQLGENGQPVLDDDGHYIGGNLVALHVQRKEPGFGEAYGADRAGEWEFMAYNADGSVQVPPQNSNFCAVCHGGEAGESVDYVFRMNLFYEGEAALVPPPVGENEISIYLYSFHESVLEVKAGTTVTWINNDEAAHTVVAAVVNADGKIVAADEPLFASDVLASVNIEPGDSFSFTFDQPGEYLYRCTIHENMTARIIVGE
ncbi:MAG: cytochrome P460 family protein [Anaerolineae bacterium]|nr:cytochrome P460 family protein [Anaerolineae bacterium]